MSLEHFILTRLLRWRISDLQDQNEVYHQLAEMYRDVTACHPDQFMLPKYKA